MAGLRVTPNVPFPSLVTGIGPVQISKQSGIWRIGLDIVDLPPVTSPFDPTKKLLLVYDINTGSFQQVSFQDLATMIIGADAPAKSLNAVAVTGPGSTITFSRVRTIMSMQVIFTSNPAVICRLEGTIDGVTWFTLATFDTSKGYGSGDIVSGTAVAVIAARANLTSLTGGTSPTVTAWISGQ